LPQVRSNNDQIGNENQMKVKLYFHEEKERKGGWMEGGYIKAREMER
jgi:hypothetical protein